MSRLIVEHNNRNLFFIHVYIYSGSAYETIHERGLAHLLEHMMFKSKKDLTVENLLIKLNSLGGIFNAATSKDYTSFYINTIDKNWKNGMNILAKVVFEPHFDAIELRNEKKVVIEEFLQYEDDVRDVCFSKAYSGFLGSHNPYHFPVKGSLDDIKKSSPEDLKRYYEKFYKSCMIYINCPAKYDANIRKYTNLKFGKYLKGTPIIDIEIPKDLKSKVSPYVDISSDVHKSQNATVLMFKGFPYNDKRNITLSLIWDILTGSLNSLLMMEVREKRGLVYTISSFNDSYRYCGYTGIYFTSSNDNLQEILSYIIRILIKLKQKGLSDNILKYSKASYINKLEYKLSGLEFSSQRSMLSAFYGTKWDEKKVLQKLIRTQNEDIIAISKDVFELQHCALVSIGKYKNTAEIQKNLTNLLLSSK
jgi:predicted Zn-dependent peptidase